MFQAKVELLIFVTNLSQVSSQLAPSVGQTFNRARWLLHCLHFFCNRYIGWHCVIMAKYFYEGCDRNVILPWTPIQLMNHVERFNHGSLTSQLIFWRYNFWSLYIEYENSPFAHGSNYLLGTIHMLENKPHYRMNKLFCTESAFIFLSNISVYFIQLSGWLH